MTISVLQDLQSASGSTNANITQAITFTAHSTIVVFAACDSSTGETISGCSDTINGTYGTALDQVNDATNTDRIASFQFTNSAAGATTVTVTFTGTPGSRAIWVVEVGNTTGAIDGHTGQNQASPGTGANATTSGNATNVNQPALIVGITYDTTAATTAGAGTGFTDEGAGWLFGSNNTARVEDKRVTTTGNQAATWTAVGGTDRYLNLVVVVNEVAVVAATRVMWISA